MVGVSQITDQYFVNSATVAGLRGAEGFLGIGGAFNEQSARELDIINHTMLAKAYINAGDPRAQSAIENLNSIVEFYDSTPINRFQAIGMAVVGQPIYSRFARSVARRLGYSYQ